MTRIPTVDEAVVASRFKKAVMGLANALLEQADQDGDDDRSYITGVALSATLVDLGISLAKHLDAPEDQLLAAIHSTVRDHYPDHQIPGKYKLMLDSVSGQAAEVAASLKAQMGGVPRLEA